MIYELSEKQMSNQMAISTPPPSSSSSPAAAVSVAGVRSPQSVLAQPHLPSSLSFNFLLPPTQPLASCPPPDHHPEPIVAVGRVRLIDILPYEGAPSSTYLRAVDALSRSLTRHNAVVIELGSEEEVVMRCALESVRMFFKARAQCGSGWGGGNWGKSGRGFYTYRAGRHWIVATSTLDVDQGFGCFGKTIYEARLSMTFSTSRQPYLRIYTSPAGNHTNDSIFWQPYQNESTDGNHTIGHHPARFTVHEQSPSATLVVPLTIGPHRRSELVPLLVQFARTASKASTILAKAGIRTNPAIPELSSAPGQLHPHEQSPGSRTHDSIKSPHISQIAPAPESAPSTRAHPKIVILLPIGKGSVSCSFLLKLLKTANILNASSTSKLDLARRAGVQLDKANVNDILIASFTDGDEILYDVDVVITIVEEFMLQGRSPTMSTLRKKTSSGERRRSRSAENVDFEVQENERRSSALEDGDLSPPCMSDAFRCLSRAARSSLSSIAKNLRLRSDGGSVFNHLLDDTPLPLNEVSSSVLVATYSHASLQNGKGSLGGKSSVSEVEKGLLTIIASDHPGIQVYPILLYVSRVCDPNGHWYLADKGSTPADLLLLTGKTLSHATAGLRIAASYRVASDYNSCGRASLTFRLMPQANAILDCSRIAAAGHVIPQGYQPISVSQFMDDLSAEEDIMCNPPDSACEVQNSLTTEPSFRSVLSDPLSGAFLEDAVVVSCGHSFGGHMLKKVMEMARCTLCNAEIDSGSLIPNLALRAAAAAVRSEDERRLFHNTNLRKRRKEGGEQMDPPKKPGKENGEMNVDGHTAKHLKGVQFPFAVNEKVLIKGNRRTPDKFVGREAVITSLCLNGWYLLKILDSGESVRLQYRSLQKLRNPQVDDGTQPLTVIQSNS
ncbi:hypothetical protein IEQ34_009484 [Dendrobium chrysotoxum]|uniref:NPH3 domain-containing protein n=1 Tax=Dendrobium chrysotoxum TaxID=161865 RepID=A0AAV7GJD1_DENCH|nr:hypothetical protein IEQ34_009484 [Dendrobium chrysotoxum]